MSDDASIQKMHELLLGALRSREQEIFKYLTILGPALAGFAWLLCQDSKSAVGVGLFIVVTIGVLLLLLLGAVYSLELGYNYRYITLQLAKLESQLGIKKAMLRKWPKRPEEFLRRYNALCCLWCTPPGMIKVFWYAFLIAIVGVTLTACFWHQDKPVVVLVPMWSVYLIVGVLCFWAAFLYPLYLGGKLKELAEAEKEAAKAGEWDPRD